MGIKTADQLTVITASNAVDRVVLWDDSAGLLSTIEVSDLAVDLQSGVIKADGTQAMLAHFNMGTFNITNVGNVDGVDVSVLSSTVATNAGTVTTHIANTSNPHGVTAAQVGAVKHDGTVALTGNWDIGASRKIQAERIDARSNLGLKLYEDGGLGIFVQDSTGWVGIGQDSPTTALHLLHGSGGRTGMTIEGVNPNFNFYENDEATDNKWWDFIVSSAQLQGRVVNDANSGAGNWITVDRTGTTVDSVVFPNGVVGLGIASPDSKLHVHLATAGAVTARADTTVTIESNAANYLSLLAPTTSLQGVVFGHSSAATDGAMIFDNTNDELIFYLNNQARVKLGGSTNSWAPTSNDGQSLGTSSLKWSQVYATIGTINTSDIRQKKSVEPSDLGLDFVKELEPIRYVLADMERPAVIEKRIEKRPVTEKKTVDQVIHEKNASGKMVRKTIQIEIDAPVYEENPVFHPNGKPVMETRKVVQKDKNTGEDVEVEEKVQAVERVPLYEDVEVEHVRSEAINHTYKRPHYGLASQQVKATMDKLGIDDFGGYIHDPEANFYGLRMDEFIAPLIKAVQELSARLEAVEAR